MARSSGSFIIGVGGHVVAIDPGTGTEVWRTKLRGTDYVTVMLSAGRVYAGAGGELFCLDAHHGTVLWHNKLKGLGLGVIGFPGDSVSVAAAAEADASAANGGAAAAT